MPGLFCTHQGIQYEIDKIIGRDYLKCVQPYICTNLLLNLQIGRVRRAQQTRDPVRFCSELPPRSGCISRLR